MGSVEIEDMTSTGNCLSDQSRFGILTWSCVWIRKAERSSPKLCARYIATGMALFLILFLGSCRDSKRFDVDIRFVATRSDDKLSDDLVNLMDATAKEMRAPNLRVIDRIEAVNKSSLTLHDVEVQVGVVNRRGDLKATDKKFFGEWPPGEKREIMVEPKDLEKVYMVIEAREGSGAFELFKLPRKKDEVVNFERR
jgi:hypothetical protein